VQRDKFLAGNKFKEKDMVYIGHWKVMTLLKTGKMKEIADEMSKTQLQVTALQELRWKEQGKLINLRIHSIAVAIRRKPDNWELDL
jgi:hypothetical protein